MTELNEHTRVANTLRNAYNFIIIIVIVLNEILVLPAISKNNSINSSRYFHVNFI